MFALVSNDELSSRLRELDVENENMNERHLSADRIAFMTSFSKSEACHNLLRFVDLLCAASIGQTVRQHSGISLSCDVSEPRKYSQRSPSLGKTPPMSTWPESVVVKLNSGVRDCLVRLDDLESLIDAHQPARVPSRRAPSPTAASRVHVTTDRFPDGSVQVTKVTTPIGLADAQPHVDRQIVRSRSPSPLARSHTVSESTEYTVSHARRQEELEDEVAGSSRFGNVAFRSWHAAMCDSVRQSQLSSELRPHKQLDDAVAANLLTGSFGNPLRIDYGTGHELHFVAWLLWLWESGRFGSRFSVHAFRVSADEHRSCSHSDHAQEHHHHHHDSSKLTAHHLPSLLADVSQEDIAVLQQLAMVLFPRYIRLMRRLQLTYCLEPAGSRGVWGLDDYHFLPYLFGAAQLIGHRHMRPKSVRSDEICEAMADDYLYLDAVRVCHSTHPHWKTLIVIDPVTVRKTHQDIIVCRALTAAQRYLELTIVGACLQRIAEIVLRTSHDELCDSAASAVVCDGTGMGKIVCLCACWAAHFIERADRKLPRYVRCR